MDQLSDGSSDNHQYQLYQTKEEFSWVCPCCLARGLPFHDCSFLASPVVSRCDNQAVDGSLLSLPPIVTNSFLRIAHLNCRSLLSNLEEVLLFIQTHKVDVMTLSETWLDETVTDLEVCPDGYNLLIFRQDRNRRGGGVAVILSSHIPCRVCPGISEGNIESIWMQLYPGSKRAVLICCVYRSPSDYHFYDNLLIECEKGFLNFGDKLIVLGDLNSDLTQMTSQQTKFLVSFMRHFHLHELVQSPTRVTATTTSQLDLILTNIPSYFQNTVAIPFGGSDHHIVLTHFCARGINRSSDCRIVYSRCYRKLDKTMLEKVLLDGSWDEIFKVDDVSVCTEVFTLVMQYVLDAVLPLKKMRVKCTSHPWSHDADITVLRHQRDWLHRRALKSGNPEDWDRYKKSRNQVTALTRSAKQKFLATLSHNLSNDSHKFWRNFKHLSTRQRVHSCIPNIDVESINQHFLTIAHKTVGEMQLSTTSPLSYIAVSDVPDMVMKEVDVWEVHRRICDLSIHKSAGIDKIPTKFIKASTFNMAMLLTKLINKSIISQTFPDIWKNAVVTQVQKSNQNCSLSNFRPISVLPVFSKILERVVFDQLVSHFTCYNLFSNKQSGFRAGYSTQDVLLHVSESWLRAIDVGQYVGAIFLDLTKAFDCVNHNILLQKLDCYGIRGGAYEWIESFLCNRTQQVSVKDSLSSKGLVTIGVPQGSILGPLLFSIYVNDLPNSITLCDVNMYADDTELHYSSSQLERVEQVLQNGLEEASNWMSVNGFKLNIDKSVCTLIGT